MNIIQNKKIAIVGGGPGGLMLARLLQLKGVAVTVYERDINANARPKGATLDLHEESGLAALAEAGLIKQFEENYRPGADKMRITDQHATIVLDDHINNNGDRSRPEIDRGPLQQILLDSLQPGTVVWDRQFVALIPQGDGWQLEFKNGELAYADIVIAADGANSKLRPYITPIKPFYAGYTAVEGAVYNSATASPQIYDLLKGGKIFAMGNSQTLIVSSKGDGSLVFYPCFKADEQWVKNSGINFLDKTQVLTWFKKEFSSWADSWHELFENAEPNFVPRPLYSMPLGQTWEASPNLTMLGDAAHLMPPYAGEGVNMAMQDALEISRCLAGDDFTDTRSAIAAYEDQMRTRASKAAQQSIDSMIAMHSPGAIDFMVSLLG